MKIFRAELGYSLQMLWAEQSNGLVFPFNEAQTPEFLDRPVHVNYRKSTCIGNILLRERNPEAAVVRQPNEFHASGKLAKKMREST
ncbi:hypothetical protein ACVW04_002249 [Bradyrhizobium sp. LM2.3]